MAQISAQPAFALRAGLRWNFGPDDVQDVLRGKIACLAAALKLVKGDLVYIPDNDQVGEGFRSRIWEQEVFKPTDQGKGASNLDLWYEVAEASRLSGRTVTIVMAESHVHPERG